MVEGPNYKSAMDLFATNISFGMKHLLLLP
jgi:hypothetical protein